MPDQESVVSSGTESTTPEVAAASTTDTQASESTAESSTPTSETPAEKQERIDWRQKQREDPDLNAYIQSQLARDRQKRERQALKSTAKQAVETENVDTALEIARRIAAEPDELDEDSQRDQRWVTKANNIKPHLDRMLRMDATGQVTNPYYIKLHQATGKAEMDRRYDADPEAFYDWAEDQIQEMKLDERVKKVAPGMAKAMAADATHAALQGVQSPLTGGTGGSGSVSIDQYNSDAALRARLRSTPDGIKQINEMMRRASQT